MHGQDPSVITSQSGNRGGGCARGGESELGVTLVARNHDASLLSPRHCVRHRARARTRSGGVGRIVEPKHKGAPRVSRIYST